MLENDKKTCFRGWLPNLKARYCLGREARRTVHAVQALESQSEFQKIPGNTGCIARISAASTMDLHLVGVLSLSQPLELFFSEL